MTSLWHHYDVIRMNQLGQLIWQTEIIFNPFEFINQYQECENTHFSTNQNKSSVLVSDRSSHWANEISRFFTLVVSWCGKLLKFSDFNRWHILANFFHVWEKRFWKKSILVKKSILEKNPKLWFQVPSAGTDESYRGRWRNMTSLKHVTNTSHATDDVIAWILTPVWLILTVTKLLEITWKFHNTWQIMWQ